MELKAGYKLTDVGVIPVDWEVRALKRISPKQSVGLVINPSTYYDDAGTVPMLVGSNIKENVIHWENAKRVSEASSSQITASCLSAGDLVTVRVGEPGVTAVVPQELDGCNCASVMIVRRSATFNSYWLCSVMNSPAGRAQVEHVQYGTAQKQFNISDAVDFKYAVPPLNEQRAIAAALSDIDTLLTKLDQLITKKRDLKQATLQQLLTAQTRLPGFSGEWVEQSIASFSAFVSKGSTPTTYGFKWVNSGVLFLRSECVSANGLDLSQSMFISESAHACLSRGEVVAGDILITITGNVGRVVQLGTDFSVGNTNQHIARIRVKDPKVSSAFVLHWLSQKKVRAEYEKNTTGQAYPQISLKQVRETWIPLPSFNEQTAIAAVLTEMDAELTALEARRDKTLAVKQSMMQELLTGRIRLV